MIKRDNRKKVNERYEIRDNWTTLLRDDQNIG
jgi:hypothetical protein